MDNYNFVNYTQSITATKRLIDLIFEKYNNMCIRTSGKDNYIINNNTPLFQFIKKLGGDNKSKDGENYLSKIILKNNNIDTNKFLAIKIIPVKDLNYNLQEVRIMEILRDYMIENNLPIFSFIYHYFICDHNKKFIYQNNTIISTIKEKEQLDNYIKLLKSVENFDYKPNVFSAFKVYYNKIKNIVFEANDVLINKSNEYNNYINKSLIIMNEYVEASDLNDFLGNYFPKLHKENISVASIVNYNILLQIMISLLILHQLNILHMDLHIANIFIQLPFKETDKAYTINYFINKKKYVVPYYNIICKISDFSRSFYFTDNKDKIPELQFTKFYKELNRFFPDEFDMNDAKLMKKMYLTAHEDNYLIIRIFDFWRFLSNYYAFLTKYIPSIELKEDNELYKIIKSLGSLFKKPNKQKFNKLILDFIQHLTIQLHTTIDKDTYDDTNINIELF